jgi:hypothetical protein
MKVGHINKINKEEKVMKKLIEKIANYIEEY